ncbi:tRNA (cytidine(34)-2'-O)-methyltransferase [Desulfovermiculus halophilus]|uniref:tRNA (cytidine(34)-2'-O)-methyltransferase n=1 Tax=Desulfovermiculus halophilus TaxID=339722 RepID=UPI00048418CA|nr:tRNA (cytidine(34)-2'-O)-methyltransferase [Desulfovermiculus halophilus]
MQLVLFQPEIPPNTGNIARLCAATRTPLHLIEPLGFSLEDRYLKRAGLDYWPHVDVHVWPEWDTFLASLSAADHVLLTSARKGRSLFSCTLTGREVLVFGPETTGLPGWLSQRHPHHVRIPIWGRVRSLNLANAAAVCLYEGYRQIGFPVPETGL